MKGVKKCCGLLLALPIMLGLSLSVSSGASALKYEVLQFPMAQPYYDDTHHFTGFKLQWDSSSYIPTFLDYYNSSYFIYNYSTEDSWCYYPVTSSVQGTSIFTTNQANNYVFATIPFYDIDHYTYSSPNSLCRTLTPFGSGNIPIASDSIIPRVSSLQPYWFPYSGAYATDLDVENGLHRTSRLNLANLFKSVPSGSFGHLTDLSIPLGSPAESVGQFTSGRHIEFDTTFFLDSVSSSDSDFNADLGLYSSNLFHLNLYSYGLSVGDSICSTDVSDNRSTPEIAPWEIHVSCSYDFTSTYPVGTVSFFLNSYTGGNLLWTYPADTVAFESVYFITDYDDTLSSAPFASSVVGGDLSSAPGSASDSNSSPDYFSSLTNMFNFSFFNPFAPLFNMFTNASSCANIPIIAGMLGSSETTYCPWWPASVRNVLTPVFGLASTMLVFGFLVRWLSSSSGNMFEDQTTHKWGNTQLKQGGK